MTWDVRRGNARSQDFADGGEPLWNPTGTSMVWPLHGQVNCLAPDCNGPRAAFHWEMKCGMDDPQPGQLRRRF
jgi:hypothetical protein